MYKLKPIYYNFPFLEGTIESFQEDKNLVFVLMPFGKTKEEKEYLSNVFFSIKNTIENVCFNGEMLKCSRADFEYELVVMNDICKKIKKANLTIFDISLPNNNVYFELGLACALDKKILLLYNHEVYYKLNPELKLPFDINQFRYIEYHTLSDLERQLQNKVESAIVLEDYTKVNIHKIYEKVKKITRHLELDTKSDQIREEYDISDFELSSASDVLDEYWDNPELESNDFKGIRYNEIENKIKSKIGLRKRYKIKYILKCLYWEGAYQQLIVQLELLPSELKAERRDYLKNKPV